MAAAERIREIAPQAEVDNDLARSLIEQVFSGYDVNLTATHMAATTLGLLSPTTRFRNMKIGRTLLGLDKNGKARLGSLEFLGDGQPMLIPFPNAEPQARQVDTGAEIVRIDPSDLVIMNPPYTRGSLRHDQFDAATEHKIKAREKELFADRPTYMAGNSYSREQRSVSGTGRLHQPRLHWRNSSGFAFGRGNRQVRPQNSANTWEIATTSKRLLHLTTPNADIFPRTPKSEKCC